MDKKKVLIMGGVVVVAGIAIFAFQYMKKKGTLGEYYGASYHCGLCNRNFGSRWSYTKHRACHIAYPGSKC